MKRQKTHCVEWKVRENLLDLSQRNTYIIYIMKLKEAIELLKSAPRSDTKPSVLNKLLTQAQAVKIVENALASFGRPKNNPCQMDDDIDPFMENRVYQVTKNKMRPTW